MTFISLKKSHWADSWGVFSPNKTPTCIRKAHNLIGNFFNKITLFLIHLRQGKFGAFINIIEIETCYKMANSSAFRSLSK